MDDPDITIQNAPEVPAAARPRGGVPAAAAPRSDDGAAAPGADRPATPRTSPVGNPLRIRL